MATTTTNLGLIEPAGQDRALVANINTNSEKIDAEAGKARANFALVQNGDTATQAISQGQLVNWKGALKKATANIASGATLSSSNLTDDSVAAEIASLNSKIDQKAGGINTTVLVQTLNTQGVTYIAQKNLYAVCNIKSTAGSSAFVSLNGVAVALLNPSSDTDEITVCFPVLQGQEIKTRANVGTYNILLYEAT